MSVLPWTLGDDSLPLFWQACSWGCGDVLFSWDTECPNLAQPSFVLPGVRLGEWASAIIMKRSRCVGCCVRAVITEWRGRERGREGEGERQREGERETERRREEERERECECVCVCE